MMPPGGYIRGPKPPPAGPPTFALSRPGPRHASALWALV